MNDKRPLLVGVYNAGGDGMFTRDIYPVLEHFRHKFRTLDQADLRALEPGALDALLLPGGWYFFKDKLDLAGRLRGFVAAGGGCVGICCGAINLCQLGLLPAEMINMAIMGPAFIEPVDGEHPVWAGVAKKSDKHWRQYERFDILNYNGWPMLLKDGAHMIASYDMDKKVAAIACAEHGQGRVVAFGPHPEGSTCAPGIFRDRDKHPMVYDGIAMGTARLLHNALLWSAGRTAE